MSTIGVVDLDRFLQQSQHGKSLLASLEQREKKWMQEEKACVDQLQLLEQKLQSFTEKSPESQVHTIRSDYQLAQMSLQQVRERMQADLQSAQERLRGEMLKFLQAWLPELAKSASVGMLMALPNPYILHVDATVDVTDTLLQLVQKSPAASKRPAAPRRSASAAPSANA